VTLTLALPYVVFIVGQYWLDVSGVVAAVTAGLVLSALGQPKIAPADWRFLHDLWEQLAFWASSLIFILASLMVPKLLLDVGWSDLISLLVLVIAALMGRAVVLWGLMPLLSGVGLSQPSPKPRRFRTTCSDSLPYSRRASCCSRCSCRGSRCGR
jgi:CPA1 family monovalent cation:H+ antiporter